MATDLVVFGPHPDDSEIGLGGTIARHTAAGHSVCYYFINDGAAPSFVVDVSAHYQRKRDALDCYRSQFAPSEPGSVATRLTASTFRQLIESRDAQLGALAGVAFAEGLVVREPIARPGLLKYTT